MAGRKVLGRGLKAASCLCIAKSQMQLKPFPSESQMKNSGFQTLVGLRQHSQRSKTLCGSFWKLGYCITLPLSFMALVGKYEKSAVGAIIDINLCAMLEAPSVSSHKIFLFPLLNCELIVGCYLRNIMKVSGTSRLPFFSSFPSGVEVVLVKA